MKLASTILFLIDPWIVINADAATCARVDQIVNNGASSICIGEGGTFNGPSELVQLDSGGKIPAVDGSALTNLPAPSSINWTVLQNYPTACSAGAFVSTLSDTPTCTSNAATATALAANGGNCTTGNYPLGVDTLGAVESCTALPETWPVGSIFLSAVSTNPNTLLGYGYWVSFSTGSLLIGIDSTQSEFDTLLEVGGAKTHILTEAELASHNHTQNSHNHTQDAHTHTQNSHNHTQDSHSHVITELRDATTGGANTNIAVTNDSSSTLGTKTTGSTTATNQAATAVNQNATATNQAATATNNAAGSGTAHSILNPYIVVYMWKRTA